MHEPELCRSLRAHGLLGGGDERPCRQQSDCEEDDGYGALSAKPGRRSRR